MPALIALQKELKLPYERVVGMEDVPVVGVARHQFAVAKVVDGQVEFVLTCVVAQYPRKRVLYVQYGAGRGGADLKEKLIEVARVLKCDWIETRCRESVARLYRRSGFETGYQVCILEV